MKLFLALVSALLLCSGCFVLDEIEKGQEIMAAHSPNSDSKKDAAEGSSDAPKTARERLAEYYAEQRAKAAGSKKSDDPADAVGACRIGRETQFTRRSDCKLRGGTFL